jgi:hypothetical protein
LRLVDRFGGLILIRFVAFATALVLMATAAEARRVALVIGQNAYAGGASATVGLPTLANPVRDARRMAELLSKHGNRWRTPGAICQ